MRFGHLISGMIFLITIFIFVMGCATQIKCTEPNVLVGNSCCLDVDNNQECDSNVSMLDVEKELGSGDEQAEAVTEETLVPEQEYKQSDDEVFAEQFEGAWNKKNYNALYNMFDEGLRHKFTQEEFNFLMKKMHQKLGIQSVSFKGLKFGEAEYIVNTAEEKGRTTAEIVYENGKPKYKAFYFFKDIDVDDVCDDDECMMKYAKISRNKLLCDEAGDLHDDCLSQFGVEDEMIEKMNDCIEIKEYYAKADCLTQLAEQENSIEPCWQIDYDRQKFNCMGKVAAINEDADLCLEYVDSLTIPGTKIQHGYCILGYVSETRDRTACKLIDRRGDVVLGAMAENCDMLRFS